MPCDILPESIVSWPSNPAGGQLPGRTVNPRGVWDPRFLGLPQCENLPMPGVLIDREWSQVEDNIVLGVPAVQNAAPGFGLQPYTGPGPIPPGGASPSLQVVAVNQPFAWSVGTALPDAGLQMQLFIDDCLIQSAYGPNHPWLVDVGTCGAPVNCTYAFVTIAPVGANVTTGRGGVQVLNACPNFVVEVPGLAGGGGGGLFGGVGWHPCHLTVGFVPPVAYNLCPPSNPQTGYSSCNAISFTSPTGAPTTTPAPPGTAGKIHLIRAVDMNATGPGAFSWMRGQLFSTQVHYLIPNVNNPIQHLYVASQIETKQVY